MLAQYILIRASLLIFFGTALPIANKATNGNGVCVANKINPSSCDDGSFDHTSLYLDVIPDIDPSVPRRRDTSDTLDDSDDSEDGAINDNNICVASAGSPGSCDTGLFEISTITSTKSVKSIQPLQTSSDATTVRSMVTRSALRAQINRAAVTVETLMTVIWIWLRRWTFLNVLM